MSYRGIHFCLPFEDGKRESSDTNFEYFLHSYPYFMFAITRTLTRDEVAEWLRRWTANPLGSARVGSNPILVEAFFHVSQTLFF